MSISNKKLIEIFNLAVKDYADHSDQKSSHWASYYDSFEKFNKEENLINFRKDQILSSGCDDTIIKKSKLDILELLDLFDNDFLKKNLSKKNIGNSNFCHKHLDYFFDFNELYCLKWFQEFEEAVFKKSKIKSICEIGGGYGSLARVILNNYNVKYILIDLPEANLISAYYLKEHFPNKSFFLYNDLKDSKNLESLESFDIFILPPWAVFDKNLKIDFFINARSMMEMNFKVIEKYFIFIQNHISQDGFFSNINRYQKKSVGENILLYKYPYDKNWEVVLSKKSFLQDHIHFLLTKRNFQTTLNNISNELKLIKKETESISRKKIQIIESIKLTIKKITKFFITKIFSVKFLNRVGKKLYNIKKNNK